MSTYSERINANEVVIFCDEHGTPTGEIGQKLDSHTAQTRMHLAFSVYVFNASGKLLITKRADSKKVWPGVWTNTCCGHLAPGETSQDAAVRRLEFELGLSAGDFRTALPTYTYKTPPYKGVIDHEFCPVLIALTNGEPRPNPNEVSDYKWVEWQWFVDQAESDGDDYSQPDTSGAPQWSWWCKDQLKQLKTNEQFQGYMRTISKA